MKKNLHASIRLEEDTYASLQEEAEQKYEGNISLLIRMILKKHIENSFKIKKKAEV